MPLTHEQIESLPNDARKSLWDLQSLHRPYLSQDERAIEQLAAALAKALAVSQRVHEAEEGERVALQERNEALQQVADLTRALDRAEDMAQDFAGQAEDAMKERDALKADVEDLTRERDEARMLARLEHADNQDGYAAASAKIGQLQAEVERLRTAAREADILLTNYLAAGKFPSGSDCEEVRDLLRAALAEKEDKG
jgi:cell fate (sporulation/competence/biofilm development) regulator YmcA (YheA/YmcA/DUF963 family)